MADVRLEPGDAAPPFSLPDPADRTVTLADYAGRKVIVYFYPAAMTPGCTTEACDFRDSLEPLEHAGYAVVGISPDAPDVLATFRDQEGLSFPLLSDPDHEVMRAYGAYGEKQNYGKTVVGVIRTTVLIDEQGVVERAMYGVKATGHVTRVLREVS